MNENSPKAKARTTHDEPKDLQEANENIRKAEGDEPTSRPVDAKKAGNKPAIDRGR